MLKDESIKAYAAWLAVCFFWGTTYLGIRIGVQHLPPALFAGIRWLFSGLIFIAYLRLKKIAWPTFREIANMAVVGFCLLFLANGTVVWAEQWVPSGLAALIVSTLPIWMAGLESILPTGNRLTLKKGLGIFIGFMGIVVLFYPDLKQSMDSAYLKGVIALFFAPLAWATGSLFSKYNPVSCNILMSAAVQMTIAGLIFILVGLGLGEAYRFHLNLPGMAAMAYLIIFGSIVGYGSYIYALAKLPAAKVALFAYVNPVIAVLLGWLLLNERLDWYVAVATALVLSGVLLVKSSRS